MTTLIDLGRAQTSAPAAAVPLAPTYLRLARGPADTSSTPAVPSPVVAEAEESAAWDTHLRAIVDFHQPQGYLEHYLAGRIAALSWRLDRLARAEVAETVQSIADAERDAAAQLAAAADPSDPIQCSLPADSSALRRRHADAKRALDVLSAVNQTEAGETVGDDRAAAALRLFAEYCASLPQCPPVEVALANPKLARPPTGWNGASLRSALAALAVNRALIDTVTASLPSLRALVDAASDRLAQVAQLTARLRRERVTPQTTLASHIQTMEASLSAQLCQTIAQLDALQLHRASPVTG